jgi:hypothetical protein
MTSPDRKKALIERYRDIHMDHDWSESVEDNFKHEMSKIGIRVDEIYHCGFHSQGDGACFEGRVYSWLSFLPSIGYDNPVLIQYARDTAMVETTQRGRYSHENSVTFNWSGLTDPNGEDEEYFLANYSPYPADDFRSVAWLNLLKQVDFDALVNDVEEAFKDHMRQLYRDLEKEYDHLTSDEVVWEAIVACGLDTEDEQEEEDHAEIC